METSILWGVTPFKFWELPEVERAVMIAHFRERRMRKAHADHVQNEVSERSARKAKPNPGQSAHDAFFGG